MCYVIPPRCLAPVCFGVCKIRMASILCGQTPCASNLVSEVRSTVQSLFPELGKLRKKIVMATSLGLGVAAAVSLPKFSTTGDSRRNCEEFIQSFKIGVNSMVGTIASHCHLLPKKKGNHHQLCQCGQQKVRLWQLLAPPQLETKNSKTWCKAFSC